MGAKCSRSCSCFPFPWKRNRKIAPLPWNKFQESGVDRKKMSSTEVLDQLHRAGFFTTVEKPGGVRVILEKDLPCSSRKNLPRRLPSVVRDGKPVKGTVVYDTEEKKIMAEIRRNEILKDKGKMARQSPDRRQKVLERKKSKLNEKIAKTQAKLRKVPTKARTTQGREPLTDENDKQDKINKKMDMPD